MPPHLIGHVTIANALHPFGLVIEHLKLGRVKNIIIVVIVLVLSRSGILIVLPRLLPQQRILHDAGQIGRRGVNGMIVELRLATVGRVSSEAARLLVGRGLLLWFDGRPSPPCLGGLAVVSHFCSFVLLAFSESNQTQTERQSLIRRDVTASANKGV